MYETVSLESDPSPKGDASFMVNTYARSDQRTEAPAPPGSNRARIWTMIVACMGVTLVIASMVALNTALGDIAVATSATQSQLTWIVDCYSVALACLLLPAGAIGDRYGRRGAFLVGLATFAIASLASTVFTNPLQLVAARGMAGVGAAFIMPATLSLLTATYGEDERAKATGIWAGVAGSGAVRCSTFGCSADRTSPPDRQRSQCFSWRCSASFSSYCNTSNWSGATARSRPRSR
jgi:sugar phosphate permease